MRNIWTITRKEYNHFFISPIAYVFMFVIFFTLGLIFFLDVLVASQNSQYVPNVTNLIQILSFPLLFFGIPALTMRSVSEENRSGTLELLLTAPITDWQIIIGKWLGAYLFLLTPIAITLVYPLILNSLLEPGLDLGVLFANYLGLILFIGATSAMGVAISSFFNNQIAALFTGMGAMIIFWIISVPSQLMQGWSSEVVKYIGIPGHFYETFMAGMIRVDDITYFVSLTIISLVIGAASIEARRWR